MSLEERLESLENRLSELTRLTADLAQAVDDNARADYERAKRMGRATDDGLKGLQKDMVRLAEAAGVRVKWKEES